MRFPVLQRDLSFSRLSALLFLSFHLLNLTFRGIFPLCRSLTFKILSEIQKEQLLFDYSMLFCSNPLFFCSQARIPSLPHRLLSNLPFGGTFELLNSFLWVTTVHWAFVFIKSYKKKKRNRRRRTIHGHWIDQALTGLDSSPKLFFLPVSWPEHTLWNFQGHPTLCIIFSPLFSGPLS